MPADHQPPPQSRIIGFQNYADDTPRELGPESGPTIPDHIALRREWEDPPAGAQPAPTRDRALKVGSVTAVVLGVALASWLSLKPSSGPPPTSPSPMNVQVAKSGSPASAIPTSAERLEVLPPTLTPSREPNGGFASPANRPPPPPRAGLSGTTPSEPMAAPVYGRPASVTADARPNSEAARQPPQVEPDARVKADTKPACAGRESRGEVLVCSDARLAALDRRLAVAFAAALHAGSPSRELEDEQDDWLAIREQAAAISTDAVASIYRQRIGELEDIAAAEAP